MGGDACLVSAQRSRSPTRVIPSRRPTPTIPSATRLPQVPVMPTPSNTPAGKTTAPDCNTTGPATTLQPCNASSAEIRSALGVVISSNRLHEIKSAAGLGATDGIKIRRTDGIYDTRTGEYLGSLTGSGWGR